MRITKTFKNVDPAKQLLVLNAALTEFTEKGFEQASTNQIVKNAGIGKGMLFYYFTNKKKLYLYLIDYCIHVIESEYLEKIDYSQSDLFERLKSISKAKWEFLIKHPNPINFIGTLFLKDLEHIDKESKLRLEALQKKWHTVFYKDLDYSLLRDDIDVKKAFQLIQWSLHGYEEDLKYRLRDQKMASIDYELYFEEYFDYLNILKTTFYKNEEEEK